MKERNNSSRRAPFLHAVSDLDHVRMVRAPPEPFPMERTRVEHEAAFIDEFVRLERIGEDELEIQALGQRA